MLGCDQLINIGLCFIDNLVDNVNDSPKSQKTSYAYLNAIDNRKHI